MEHKKRMTSERYSTNVFYVKTKCFLFLYPLKIQVLEVKTEINIR